MRPGRQDWRHAALELEGCEPSILLVLLGGEAGYLVENHQLEPVGLCSEPVSKRLSFCMPQ
jgi:hypothetical protein